MLLGSRPESGTAQSRAENVLGAQSRRRFALARPFHGLLQAWPRRRLCLVAILALPNFADRPT